MAGKPDACGAQPGAAGARLPLPWRLGLIAAWIGAVVMLSGPVSSADTTSVDAPAIFDVLGAALMLGVLGTLVLLPFGRSIGLRVSLWTALLGAVMALLYVPQQPSVGAAVMALFLPLALASWTIRKWLAGGRWPVTTHDDGDRATWRIMWAPDSTRLAGADRCSQGPGWHVHWAPAGAGGVGSLASLGLAILFGVGLEGATPTQEDWAVLGMLVSLLVCLPGCIFLWRWGCRHSENLNHE